jgi:hypothetical protein
MGVGIIKLLANSDEKGVTKFKRRVLDQTGKGVMYICLRTNEDKVANV